MHCYGQSLDFNVIIVCTVECVFSICEIQGFVSNLTAKDSISLNVPMRFCPALLMLAR